MGLILIAAVLATLTFSRSHQHLDPSCLNGVERHRRGILDACQALHSAEFSAPKDLSSALGINASLFNLAQFVGPAIAGVFIAVFDTSETQFGFAFAFNSVTFLAYLLVLFKIRFREGAAEERRGEQAATFFEDFMAGPDT